MLAIDFGFARMCLIHSRRLSPDNKIVHRTIGGGRESVRIVPGTAVVRVQTRSMIFTTCGMSLWVEGYARFVRVGLPTIEQSKNVLHCCACACPQCKW